MFIYLFNNYIFIYTTTATTIDTTIVAKINIFSLRSLDVSDYKFTLLNLIKVY